MSRAVILPAPGGSTALPDGGTVLDRLIAQIREAGCDDITVLIRPGADFSCKAAQLESAGPDADLEHIGEIAFGGTGPLFLAFADLVASQTTVAAVLSDSSRRSGVLVGADDPAAAPVSVERGLVTGPGPGPARLGGLAKVSEAHLARLERHWPASRTAARAGETPTDAFDAVLAALHARAVPVGAYRTPGLVHVQARDEEDAVKTIAEFTSVDMDAWRLKNAVKHDDDLFATYAVSSWSPRLVKLAARLGVGPTPITWVSIVLALGAAGIFATGSAGLAGGADASVPWYALAAALMYFSFVFDCVDGQLARYTQNFSAFGGWLDMMADRSKEFLIYAGLAAGAALHGSDAAAWGLAIAAMITQTVRHTADTWYAVLLDTAVVRQARRRETAPPVGRAAHLGQRLGSASEQVMGAHRSPLYWAKRTIVAPVGERWLLLAVAAVAFGPQIAIGALLVWQLLALGYTTAGRCLRTLAARTAALRRPDRSAHRDDGILARLMPPGGHRFANLPAAATALAAACAGAAVWRAAAGDVWTPLALAAAALLAALTAARSDHDGIFDWLIPAGLRAVELGVVTAAGIVAGVAWPVLFALLGVIALYFYDLAAGLDKAASPVARRDLGLGWPARGLVAIIAAAAAVPTAPAVATAVFAALAVYVAAVFIGAIVAGTVRAARA
ncbi:CDP-alcohol phosphatidyltransferase family protein [Glycomyces arizonensis]|uniref:CDP-alcohol phosphatidyltransferase family protein n=1 Tax=Glycomyces arizonensis TaxID=256035 RepID=UPI0003F58B67|nr:CDP-alcohol phosphatidyltransferase family protein [Glycomyces arizonensis]